MYEQVENEKEIELLFNNIQKGPFLLTNYRVRSIEKGIGFFCVVVQVTSLF